MKPKPEYCKLNCEYNKTGKGFVPDILGTDKIKFAVQLEAPGGSEVGCEKGENGYGIPLWGASGYLFEEILNELKITRQNVLICNTIRCRPPGNSYPIGKERKLAEKCCEHWNGKLVRYDPNMFIVTFHPAAALGHRTPQFKIFIQRAISRAKMFCEEGYRPLVLMGEKAMNSRATHLKGGIKRWQGHYWEGKLSG